MSTYSSDDSDLESEGDVDAIVIKAFIDHVGTVLTVWNYQDPNFWSSLKVYVDSTLFVLM